MNFTEDSGLKCHPLLLHQLELEAKKKKKKKHVSKCLKIVGKGMNHLLMLGQNQTL